MYYKIQLNYEGISNEVSYFNLNKRPFIVDQESLGNFSYPLDIRPDVWIGAKSLLSDMFEDNDETKSNPEYHHIIVDARELPLEVDINTAIKMGKFNDISPREMKNTREKLEKEGLLRAYSATFIPDQDKPIEYHIGNTILVNKIKK